VKQECRLVTLDHSARIGTTNDPFKGVSFESSKECQATYACKALAVVFKTGRSTDEVDLICVELRVLRQPEKD
jgi:hypothetical protein